MALEIKYFVIKPKGTGPHAEASQAAMKQYARIIRSHDVELSDSLLEWAQREKCNSGMEEIRDAERNDD